MADRTNEDVIRIVNKWQNAGMVHELTCGVDSRHAMLEPVERGGKVVLVCPTCQAVQEHIPDFVLNAEAALDFSLRMWAAEREENERRWARQDAIFIYASTILGGGLLGGLWWGTPGGFGGILFGAIVAWFAVRGKRKSISRP